MMLRKYYTYEVIHNGTIRGSGLTWVWFWRSSLFAYKTVTTDLPDGYQQINFRRIK